MSDTTVKQPGNVTEPEKVVRQPGSVETSVDIEYPTAPEWKGDHGMTQKP
jgi:hypothetical protein